jgi:hypothetical protein
LSSCCLVPKQRPENANSTLADGNEFTCTLWDIISISSLFFSLKKKKKKNQFLFIEIKRAPTNKKKKNVLQLNTPQYLSVESISSTKTFFTAWNNKKKTKK